MPGDSRKETGVAQIEEIRGLIEEFDNTGDETRITEHLAEDVTFLPPGSKPISGKPAVIESLEAFPTNAYDVKHEGEDLLISDDFAVDYVSVEGKKTDEDGDPESEVSLKGIDVYRRDSDGDWTIAFSIWNDQA